MFHLSATRAPDDGEGRPSLLRRFASALWRQACRRPKLAALATTFAVLDLGIVVNSLVLQPGRHPAPLFGGWERGPADLADTGATDPASRGPAQASWTAPQKPVPPPPARTAPQPPKTSPEPPRARMSSAQMPAAQPPTGTVPTVQRLLAELGYAPGSVDGKIGEGTRRAIKQFELDRGLPASGVINERLLKELTKVTGRPAG